MGESGAWFAEACLFQDNYEHTATVVAGAESELAVLPAKEYHRIVQKFPRLLNRHQVLQDAVKNEKVNIAQLAYKVDRHRVSMNHRGSQTGFLSFNPFWRFRNSKVHDSPSSFS